MTMGACLLWAGGHLKAEAWCLQKASLVPPEHDRLGISDLLGQILHLRQPVDLCEEHGEVHSWTSFTQGLSLHCQMQGSQGAAAKLAVCAPAGRGTGRPRAPSVLRSRSPRTRLGSDSSLLGLTCLHSLPHPHPPSPCSREEKRTGKKSAFLSTELLIPKMTFLASWFIWGGVFMALAIFLEHGAGA